MGSILDTIAIFLDKFLRPFAVNTPSNIRDTSDFLKKLEDLRSMDHILSLCHLITITLYWTSPVDPSWNSRIHFFCFFVIFL
ncbi:hypothetical protein GDO81_006217 [Engystomops pustulosus]|uniref:Uncharacterized protein n=1 Tax=Engystomops pustulosus TaxID=76066 RepID=A0AAV7CV68_ENGPU|nr:hypothetical protein GDO81_006217 [Engystomops pustulosus]